MGVVGQATNQQTADHARAQTFLGIFLWQQRLPVFKEDDDVIEGTKAKSHLDGRMDGTHGRMHENLSIRPQQFQSKFCFRNN